MQEKVVCLAVELALTYIDKTRANKLDDATPARAADSEKAIAAAELCKRHRHHLPCPTCAKKEKSIVNEENQVR